MAASEAAEMLNVSTATAHRAMQVLARRKMLVRRRNRGTFVGPHFEIKQHSMGHRWQVLFLGVAREKFIVG